MAETLAERYRAMRRTKASVPDGQCAANACDQASAYRVRFTACGACASSGRPECMGHHRLCARHTGELRRKGRLPYTGDIARIESVGTGRYESGDGRG